MIQLIVNGKELTNISKQAKEWFYNLVLNGEDGPFSVNEEKKQIILVSPSILH